MRLLFCLLFAPAGACLLFGRTSAAQDAPILGDPGRSPRLLLEDVVIGGYQYPAPQNHSVLFQPGDASELFVGGTDFVLRLNTDDFSVEEIFRPGAAWNCREGPCEQVITVIEKFPAGLLVCGTNGLSPLCWDLPPSGSNRSDHAARSYGGTGISPFTYWQNSLTLRVEGDLYAAAPLDTTGSSLQFRRKSGGRSNVWMYDTWVTEPTFISLAWVRRKEDEDNEKIYMFFREKNSDPSPEAEPWISRVARVCKLDEGGSKRFFQNMWTSFLKARLVCGFPEESLYFNRLLDVFVLHAEDWRQTAVYGLFSSSWNSTAVCVYSMGMIEDVFENSTFKGYDGDVRSPRPGTCVKNSKRLPLATIHMVKDYPEMDGWVQAVHHGAPFYVSGHNYSRILVDRVRAADERTYNVLILATDSGKIHRVLEAGLEPFVISQVQLSGNSSVQSMKLDSRKRNLIVGFADKVSVMQLQNCQQYNASCQDCVLGRDPYCAWTESGCGPAAPGGVQSLIRRQIDGCSTSAEEEKQENRTRRDAASPEASHAVTVHAVPLGVPFYLSCPIHSYHATYTWERGHRKRPCLQMHSSCLLLIHAVTPDDYGGYECVSTERGFVKVVKRYRLAEPNLPVRPTPACNGSHLENDAPILATDISRLTLGLLFALSGAF